MKKALKWAGIGLIGLIVLGALTSSGEDKVAPTEPKVAPGEPGSDRPRPAKPAEPELTSAQENAVASAQSYVDMSGFSRKGLIQQLSSPAGDGFSKVDATFAANHVDANWNEEAVESARDYLEMSSFSREGLVEQLTSSAGDGFTPAQAQYAVSRVY